MLLFVFVSALIAAILYVRAYPHNSVIKAGRAFCIWLWRCRVV
jgi:hypothetical protein